MHGIARLDAGPHACAITPADPAAAGPLARAMNGVLKEDRILLPLARPNPVDRVQELIHLLGG